MRRFSFVQLFPFMLLTLALAALVPVTAHAQTITFTYNLSCTVPPCPSSNMVVATQVGQVASDLVPIAAVNSDVTGYTNPVPVGGGSLNWTSSPATYAQCFLALPPPDDCSAKYGNPGGSASIVGSVFGLPSGSTLLTASFQGGATSGFQTHFVLKQFSGWVNISYVNPVILANLGLAGLPNSGPGFLSDYAFNDVGTGDAYFTVSVTLSTGNLQVIHNFTGGTDGAAPESGPTMDAAGNLYGTTVSGGGTGCNIGCGTVYKLTHKSSGWILNPLYAFNGGNDGANPSEPVVVGPNGSLYGTTGYGGGCSYYSGGCGTVFNLRPAAAACKTALCPWTETLLYRFEGGGDGFVPSSGVLFDKSGNLYGTTQWGGIGSCNSQACGIVYELMPSNGGWSENVLYNFTGGSDGGMPSGGLIFDQAGNLYGTTAIGGNTGGSCGNGCGTVFELMPSGSGWTEQVLYSFQGGSDGASPSGGLVFDKSGNLYGVSSTGAFMLTATGAGWTFALIYGGTLVGSDLLMDAAGNLYGTSNGPYGYGSVFQLAPWNGTWTYYDLYDFTGGDGSGPSGSLVLDTNSNLYGVTSQGGANGDGVVFELPPR